MIVYIYFFVEHMVYTIYRGLMDSVIMAFLPLLWNLQGLKYLHAMLLHNTLLTHLPLDNVTVDDISKRVFMN